MRSLLHRINNFGKWLFSGACFASLRARPDPNYDPLRTASEDVVFNENVQWGEHGLTRTRLPDFPAAVGNVPQYEYRCKCGEILREGPSGGCAVNAVCRVCRINYGCLPGYWGDPVFCTGPSKHKAVKVSFHG